MLGLAQGAQRRLDDRADLVHRAEVVVEDGLADDVEGAAVPVLLHVHHLARVGEPVELVHEAGGAVGEHAHHAVHPGLVKARDQRAAALLPHLEGGGDQAVAHERLEDLGEHALVVGEDVLLEDMANDGRVGGDHEDLWPKAQPALKVSAQLKTIRQDKTHL